MNVWLKARGCVRWPVDSGVRARLPRRGPTPGIQGEGPCPRNRYSDREPNTATNGALFRVGGQLVLECPPPSTRRRRSDVEADSVTANQSEAGESDGRTRIVIVALWRRLPADQKTKAG